MSNDEPSEELAEELKSIEAALRGLSPASGRLDRDRLMYLAGQASAVASEARQSATRVASYRRYGWPLATATSLLLAMTLGGMLIFSPRAGERIVYVDRPNTGGSIAVTQFPASPVEVSSSTSQPNQSDYIQLRNLVLARGIDAMPMPKGHGNHKSQEQIPAWPVLWPDLLKTEKEGST
jgi:hypothetical protein